ncbi:hypothetical protein [Kosakonia sp.]|uniref:hypothetical protein n=1 Tax=Kosakonia sp. TaxID=1916651 RepID=UPI00289A63DD|nr:hypothetical protein [Kosakonia sp.]
MINPPGSRPSLHPSTVESGRTPAQPVSSAAAENASVNVNSQVKNAVVLSSLAQQLSDSASRADTGYAGLNRKALAAKAAARLQEISGPAWDASRARHDADVPDSTDPERLARAEAATQFVHQNGKNPFAGLSRDKLALITYDDSGLYTINERRAALKETADQEYAWRKEVVAKAMAEYSRSGKLTDFFSEVLEHYQSLPAIEQAQYPDDYAAKLQQWIDLDYNYFTDTVEGKGQPGDILTLQQSLDILK